MTEEDATARVVLGRYRVLGELGRGAMGIVYKTHDLRLDRIIALKTIRKDRYLGDEAPEAELVDRFWREARAAGRLSHPGIVTVYDMTDDAGDLYIAMEFVDGVSLRSRMKATPRMPVVEAARIAIHICEALHYAHAQGVVHRDVKPDNIICVADGGVKITDFGVARLGQSSTTQTGRPIGTPRYMAPEQWRGETVDGRADVFSVGVILYEMLTGKPVFAAKSTSELLYMVLHEEPPVPSLVNPALPHAIDPIVRKALARDVADRYPSAAALAEALTPLAGDAGAAIDAPSVVSGAGGAGEEEARTSRAPAEAPSTPSRRSAPSGPAVPSRPAVPSEPEMPSGPEVPSGPVAPPGAVAPSAPGAPSHPGPASPPTTAPPRPASPPAPPEVSTGMRRSGAGAGSNASERPLHPPAVPAGPQRGRSSVPGRVLAVLGGIVAIAVLTSIWRTAGSRRQLPTPPLGSPVVARVALPTVAPPRVAASAPLVLGRPAPPSAPVPAATPVPGATPGPAATSVPAPRRETLAALERSDLGDDDKLALVEREAADPSDGATDVLLGATRSPSILVSMAGIKALGGRPCARVEERLVALLDDTQWQRRAWAAKILGQNGCTGARAALTARRRAERDARAGTRMSEALDALEGKGGSQ